MEIITLSMEEMNEELANGNMKIIRKRYDPPNLYGKTKKDTARRMNNELKYSLHESFWDEEGDGTKYKSNWDINKSIPDLTVLPLRLQLILASWNQYPYRKELTLWYNNQNDLHLYDLSGKKLLGDSSHKINDEERLALLEVMIDLDVHNSNGWKLDGSNYHQPEKYPPKYSEPWSNEEER